MCVWLLWIQNCTVSKPKQKDFICFIKGYTFYDEHDRPILSYINIDKQIGISNFKQLVVFAYLKKTKNTY